MAVQMNQMNESKGIVVINLNDAETAAEMLERGMVEEVDSTVSDIEDPTRRQQAAEVVRRDFKRHFRML